MKRPPALVLSCLALLVLPGCGHDEPKKTTGFNPTGVGRSSASPTRSASADPAVSASTLPAASAGGQAATVPQVTGVRLSEGETLLKSQGFLSLNVVDASGQGRTIIEKSNWVIVSQIPPAGSAAVTGTPVTLNVSKPTDALPTISPTKGVVPNVVCRDLQTAQDAMRTAGFYLLRPKDGLGKGRFPLADRNWIVVGQSVAADSRPATSTRIDLTVVKYGESTGNSGCRS